MIGEMLPIMTGIVLGSIMGYFRPPVRPLVGVLLAVLLGAAAVVLSGEFRLNWGYLLVDVPLVAISAKLSKSVVRRLRWRADVGRAAST